MNFECAGASRRGAILGAVMDFSFENRTVLLIDDEEIVLKVTKRMLERIGLKVLTASSGAEGVEVFQENHGEIACIILDMAMPGMDGESTFSHLRQVEPEVPVVFSSGYNQDEAFDRLSGRGANAFLQKPFEPARLYETLKNVFVEAEAARTH